MRWGKAIPFIELPIIEQMTWIEIQTRAALLGALAAVALRATLFVACRVFRFAMKHV